ncbi:MAG: hypothetical protein WCK09_21940 [Bacteroidota bacterium]
MAKIGFSEELQPNGQIARSSTRLISMFLGFFTILLLAFLAYWHQRQMTELFELSRSKSIDQGTLVVLLKSMSIIDPMLLMILAVMIFAPKYVQKLAELKLGKLSELPKEVNGVAVDDVNKTNPDEQSK